MRPLNSLLNTHFIFHSAFSLGAQFSTTKNKRCFDVFMTISLSRFQASMYCAMCIKYKLRKIIDVVGICHLVNKKMSAFGSCRRTQKTLIKYKSHCEGLQIFIKN